MHVTRDGGFSRTLRFCSNMDFFQAKNSAKMTIDLHICKSKHRLSLICLILQLDFFAVLRNNEAAKKSFSFIINHFNQRRLTFAELDGLHRRECRKFFHAKLDGTL